jgi:hypothetical protein
MEIEPIDEVILNCPLELSFYVRDIKPNKKVCYVCMMENEQYDRYKLSCKHEFHTRCLRKYCGSIEDVQCPICKDTIEPINKRELKMFQKYNNR